METNLAAGSNTILTGTFSPTSLGTRTAILRINSKLGIMCEEFDATSFLGKMTLAEVLAADAKGPGTAQRQAYVRQCIKENCIPVDSIPGEILPESLATRKRNLEAWFAERGVPA